MSMRMSMRYHEEYVSSLKISMILLQEYGKAIFL